MTDGQNGRGDAVADDPRDAIFATDGMATGLGRRTGNASIILLSMVVVRGVLLIGSIAVLARLISPAEYGIFAMAIPGVMLATSLSNLGLPQAIVQRKSIDHATVSTLFWLNIGSATLAGVMLGLLGWPISGMLETPEVLPVFWSLGAIVLSSAIAGQYIAILRRTLRIREIEFANFVGEVVGVVAAILGALVGLSYWALVLQRLMQPLVTLILLAVSTGWTPSGPGSARPRAALDSIVFGGFVAGSSMVNRLTDYAGNFVAASSFGEAVTGLFYRARNLADMSQRKVLIPLSGAFVPALSRLQDDPEAFSAMFVRLISRTNLVLMPVAVLFATGSGPLVEILLGEDWLGTAPLLAWMSLIALRGPLQSGLHFVMIAQGKSRSLFFLSMGRLVLVTVALVLGALGGLVTMVAALAVMELLFTAAVMLPVAVARSPLSFGVIWRAALFDVAYAAAVAAVIAGLLQLLPELSALAAGGFICGALLVAFGLRVLLSAELRRDVMQVMSRVLAAAGRRGSRPVV